MTSSRRFLPETLDWVLRAPPEDLPEEACQEIRDSVRGMCNGRDFHVLMKLAQVSMMHNNPWEYQTLLPSAFFVGTVQDSSDPELVDGSRLYCVIKKKR